MSDDRIWRITSDYLANDSSPYSTNMLLELAEESNKEYENTEDQPFDLYIRGNEIVDLNTSEGNDGFIVAVLWQPHGTAVLDSDSPTGAIEKEPDTPC